MTGEFAMLGAAAAGMDVQRAALDVAARNVAAAQVAGPHDRFARLVPVIVASGAQGDEPDAALASRVDALERADAPFGAEVASGSDPAAPVRLAGTRVENGRDVDVVTEMVAVLDAQRAFDANASLFDAGKRLAERTIDAGRL